MLERYTQPTKDKFKKVGRGVTYVTGGAAVFFALLPSAVAGANSAPNPERLKLKSPVGRVAKQLERKVQNPNADMNYDATNTLYWGRTKDGAFKYRTEVPLTARVGARHVLRYFGMRNVCHDRDGLDVFPIPADAVKAESQYDGFYHHDVDPSDHGTIQLDPKTADPTTLLTYPGLQDEPSIRVGVGATSFYGRDVVLIPPAHGTAPAVGR